MLQRILFGLDLIELSFELVLSSFILVRNQLVVLLKSIVVNFELLKFVEDHMSNFYHVVSERFFNLGDRLVELLLYFDAYFSKYGSVYLVWHFIF
jgi:hypothetical protein